MKDTDNPSYQNRFLEAVQAFNSQNLWIFQTIPNLTSRGRFMIYFRSSFVAWHKNLLGHIIWFMKYLRIVYPSIVHQLCCALFIGLKFVPLCFYIILYHTICKHENKVVYFYLFLRSKNKKLLLKVVEWVVKSILCLVLDFSEVWPTKSEHLV